jgi:hypothetical protein
VTAQAIIVQRILSNQVQQFAEQLLANATLLKRALAQVQLARQMLSNHIQQYAR